MSPATSVDVNFASTSPVEDPNASDHERQKLLLTRIDGVVVVATTPDPITYVIDNNQARFILVRGDAARGLSASQPADDKHWYICLWVDESLPPSTEEAVPQPTSASDWARLKGCVSLRADCVENSIRAGADEDDT